MTCSGVGGVAPAAWHAAAPAATANAGWLAGLSKGDGMSHRVACEAADVVAHVAPMPNPLQTEACRPSGPVTVAFAHEKEQRATKFFPSMNK